MAATTRKARMTLRRKVQLGVEQLEQRDVPTYLGNQIFPLDNPWNQNISQAPLHANNATIIANLNPSTNLHLDWSDIYGIPINVVNSSVPNVMVGINNYWDESDNITTSGTAPIHRTFIPIPSGGVAIEGDPNNSSGDRHMLIYNQTTNELHETGVTTRPSTNGTTYYQANGYAYWDLDQNWFRPQGWTSTDAAGLPIMPGLARPDEIFGQGVVNHPLRFTLQNSKILHDWIYPGSHRANNGNNSPTTQPPMGARFRLNATYYANNIQNNPSWLQASKVMALGLVNYGLILCDNGSNWYITGQKSPVWTQSNPYATYGVPSQSYSWSTFLSNLQSIPGSAFEMVSLTPIVTSLSVGSGPAGTVLTINGKNFSGAGGRLHILFGATEATTFTILSDSQISVTVPAGSGTVDVRVQSGEMETNFSPGGTPNLPNPRFWGYGTSANTAADNFTYSAAATPSVSLALTGGAMAENGGQAVVTATLSATSTSAVTVTLGYGGSASHPADYTRSGAGTSIVIAAGSLSNSLTLTAVQDATDEVNETIIVDITGVTNGTENGTQQVTATITDDDNPPTVTLGLAGGSPPENGGVATVTATLSAASSFAVTVNLSFGGTAANPADYTRSGTQIVIAAGATSGSITLTGVNDPTDETNETVIVDIASVTNGTESGTQQVTATIVDDDNPPTVTLGLAGGSPPENGGVATVTATLSAASSFAVTVNLSFGGTAANPADYTRSGTQIVIAAGATSGSITLTGVNDPTDEPNETVIVDIASVTNGTESGTQQVTATIVDDDNPPTVTLGLAGSPLAENGGVATVTATLSAASSFAVTVNLSFGGTAANPADYTRSATQIIIAAGATSGSITLTGVNDPTDESNETVIVDITGVTNGTESGTQQVTATITDDDNPPTITLGLAGSPLAESGGVATVTATLSAASSFAVTVTLSFGGTAANPADYMRSGTQIVIAAGATSGSITLTGVNDPTDEPNETVIVDIASVTNGTESGTQQVTATITDDDNPPTITLGLAGSPLAESGGVATVTATLSAASSFAVTVTLSFGGTAANPADYMRSGTQIVIAAGATSGSITLTGVDDTFKDANETVIIDITIVTNGSESGIQQVTATIADDEKTRHSRGSGAQPASRPVPRSSLPSSGAETTMLLLAAASGSASAAPAIDAIFLTTSDEDAPPIGKQALSVPDRAPASAEPVPAGRPRLQASRFRVLDRWFASEEWFDLASE